jgi:hypothetical protein
MRKLIRSSGERSRGNGKRTLGYMVKHLSASGGCLGS